MKPIVSLAQSHVVQAQQLSGLVLEMTGVLGRRTRWQAFDTPQLVLKAKSDAGKVIWGSISIYSDHAGLIESICPRIFREFSVYGHMRCSTLSARCTFIL